jgi:hypothetical protein
MSKRLVANCEVAFSVDETNMEMPAFLRKKSEEGRGARGQTICLSDVLKFGASLAEMHLFQGRISRQASNSNYISQPGGNSSQSGEHRVENSIYQDH